MSLVTAMNQLLNVIDFVANWQQTWWRMDDGSFMILPKKFSVLMSRIASAGRQLRRYDASLVGSAWMR